MTAKEKDNVYIGDILTLNGFAGIYKGREVIVVDKDDYSLSFLVKPYGEWEFEDGNPKRCYFTYKYFREKDYTKSRYNALRDERVKYHQKLNNFTAQYIHKLLENDFTIEEIAKIMRISDFHVNLILGEEKLRETEEFQAESIIMEEVIDEMSGKNDI